MVRQSKSLRTPDITYINSACENPVFILIQYNFYSTKIFNRQYIISLGIDSKGATFLLYPLTCLEFEIFQYKGHFYTIEKSYLYLFLAGFLYPTGSALIRN